MWVKRSEWERMKKQIFVLEHKMASLVHIHEDIDHVLNNDNAVDMLYKGLHRCPIYTHTEAVEEAKKSDIKTDAIPDLTLEELARFVIDGTPIKRKQEVDVEFRGE